MGWLSFMMAAWHGNVQNTDSKAAAVNSFERANRSGAPMNRCRMGARS